MKTIFFGTQPYDRESFDRINADYGIRIKYHRSHLNICLLYTSPSPRD